MKKRHDAKGEKEDPPPEARQENRKKKPLLPSCSVLCRPLTDFLKGESLAKDENTRFLPREKKTGGVSRGGGEIGWRRNYTRWKK